MCMMLVKSYRGRRVQKKVTDSNKTELFVVKDRAFAPTELTRKNFLFCNSES